jgi:hypothetical protein
MTLSEPAVDPTQTPTESVLLSFAGANRLEHEDDYSLLSSAAVKIIFAILGLPHTQEYN